MEPLLKTIAREYSERYFDLKPVCFLFPNKRCGAFFKKYMALFGKKTEELPHILTISELMAQIARKTEAGRIQQLFLLYKAYLEIIQNKKEPSIDFDDFRGWGEIVLSDFNIVDLYLADPNEIFKNVKDYREITSNFLSEEQKEVMKEYFGIEDFGDTSSFWKNFENTSELKTRFLNLWQVLAPLHEKFVTSLAEEGLGNAGSIYREAAEKVISFGRKVLPYKKIVAVGFNALTESERSLFIALQSAPGYDGFDDFTDFIWDLTGPVLNDKRFSASRFVSYNRKKFPSPEWLLPSLKKEEIKEYPDIRVISAPSLTSQAKIAGELLSEYSDGKNKNMVTDAEIALVLPDESLLSNVLFSLPEDLGDINLTMGYNFRQTAIASFMVLVRRLYSTMKERESGNVFYAKDLKLFFTHPYSFFLFPASEIEALLSFISSAHKVSLNLGEISQHIPSFNEIIDFPSKKSKGEEIFGSLDRIFEVLICNISAHPANSGIETQDKDQITIYREYIAALEESIKHYEIKVNPLSVLYMVDRLVSNEKIGFEGEPLSGLQIMGTLETRCLDFRHIIVMSMNEGIMPRKAFNSTFIPETLRKAYGLPPARYAEEIFGYYFYRMISRAEKVTLIYDGRTISGLRGGESRYLLQLKHNIPADKLHEEAWQYEMQAREETDASVEKTPGIRELLNRFTLKDENRKNFSASSLNTYRECQVRFFLQNVLNINSDPEKGEYIDAITIGNVVHNVMMRLYLPFELRKKHLVHPVVITSDRIRNILSDEELIRNVIISEIQSQYYDQESDNDKPLDSGVSEMVALQIFELVKAILEYDLKLTPFNLLGCEISQKLEVTLSSGRKVNFNFAIDRLDEIEIEGERRLRVVDYKTGSKKLSAKSLDDLFEGGYAGSQIFQLYVYSWLLGKIGVEGWQEVVTQIYYVPDLVKGEGSYPEFGRKKEISFKPFAEEFSRKIEEMIENIFTSPVFSQPGDSGECSYCAFRSFCNK